jgi:catechol 2,3-dioxygenase-like lactoylglutathione lyase family enzyme
MSHDGVMATTSEGAGADVGFDHATLVVTDLPRALEFLTLLDFVEIKRVVVEGDTMSAYMGIPAWKADHVTLVHSTAPTHQEIQLLQFHHPEPRLDGGSGDLQRTGFSHICLRVTDLEATVERLRRAGFGTRNEPMTFHDRILVFLEGPAGVTVELAQWLTPTASAP